MQQSQKVLWVVHCSSKKFERMAREAMNIICLRVLKESNKSRFDSYSVRNSLLIISHITFWDCRVHIFSDNLSRNSCTNRHDLCPPASRFQTPPWRSLKPAGGGGIKGDVDHERGSDADKTRKRYLKRD